MSLDDTILGCVRLYSHARSTFVSRETLGLLMNMMPKPPARRAGMIDVHFGKKLVEARTFRKMSQETLGDELGVSWQQVQKYEKGINRITAAALVRLSDILGIKPEWFFEGIGAPGGEAPPTIGRDQIKLLEGFDRIDNDTVRALLITFVRQFADSLQAKAVKS